ncbi:MAG TPA: hypothetical protein GX745_03475 [Clostridiales bacterium]|nr:hypothetical protein [Clostridiales bacterium]
MEKEIILKIVTKTFTDKNTQKEISYPALFIEYGTLSCELTTVYKQDKKILKFIKEEMQKLGY